MKIYLHIGMPKTGTTYLQGYLASNRRVLINLDYYYPKTYGGEKSHWFLSKQKCVSFGVDYYKYIDALKDEISSCGCSNVILSEEELYAQGFADLDFLFDNYEVKVVAFVRSPFLYEQSAIYFEALSYTFQSNSPVGPSPFNYKYVDDGWLPRAYYSTLSLINNWLNFSSTIDIRIHYFDRAIFDNNLSRYFLAAVDCPFSSRLKEKENKINKNLSLEHLYRLFLAHSNLVPLKLSVRQLLLDELTSLSLASSKKYKYSLFPHNYLSMVDHERIKSFNEIAKMIGEDYLEFGKEKLISSTPAPYADYGLPAELQRQICSKLSPDIQKKLLSSVGERSVDGFQMPILPNGVDFLSTLALYHSYSNSFK